ncbi:hypothetical protein JR316_0012280 [Psilocybe cubensis]|uniref:F-box domain-containing protein n=2 Tax=Psilocybe cubensis TaxID=181762 RepID=A0A8H8CGU7_PSICU|nr:hypothetical protein JR316_0012280 [Psilocybe cubensis]KAH9475169.1 hypothetical protein JR316_0012280 [Psilocybe cubensis]
MPTTTGLTRRNTEPIINTLFTDTKLGKNEKIAYIDNEIKRVEDSIVKLVMQRASLKRSRNAYSPAVNLPPELLSLIFEFACLPGCSGHDHKNDLHGEGLHGEISMGVSIGHGAVTPLFIGTVCSAWRRVAQSTTQLWSNVTVYMNNRHADTQAALLQTWLKHSGQRPLFIKLVEDDTNDQEDDNEEIDWGIDVTSTAVINVLAAHSKQWHTIDIFVPHSWKSVLAKIRHELPLLTNATLRVADCSPSLARVDAFAFAPQLREVRLVGYSVTDVHLPWAQLHRLDGEYFSPGDCLDTLHLGPQLRTCQFEQLSRGMQPFNIRPIRHEYLTSLELIMDTANDLNTLFGALTLPHLTELVLSLSDEESVLWPVIPLMRRSRFKLQSLHLVGSTPEEQQLIGFLEEQPSLKSLLLINPLTDTGGKLSYRFIDAMTSNKSIKTDDTERGEASESRNETGTEAHSSHLLPMLEHFEYQGTMSFSSHDLVDLLASRWRLMNNQESVRKTHPPNFSVFFGEAVIYKTEPADMQIMDESPPITSQTYHNPTSASSSQTDEEGSKTPAGKRTLEIAQLRTVVITTSKKLHFTTSDTQRVQQLMAEGMRLDFLATSALNFMANT